MAVLAALYFGWYMPTERYITPKRGLGYALGIIGGSLMLLLLLYSLRKRYTWLRFLGPTPSWFRFHMVLGVLGPLCILYHANFSTGATNSNVALFSMLIVAGSGLVGRYIYAHIHHGLYGRKLELSELRTRRRGPARPVGRISFLPELVTRIEGCGAAPAESGPRVSLLGFAKPLVVALHCGRAALAPAPLRASLAACSGTQVQRCSGGAQAPARRGMRLRRPPTGGSSVASPALRVTSDCSRSGTRCTYRSSS